MRKKIRISFILKQIRTQLSYKCEEKVILHKNSGFFIKKYVQIDKGKNMCYNRIRKKESVLLAQVQIQWKRLYRQNRHHPTGLYPIGTWK